MDTLKEKLKSLENEKVKLEYRVKDVSRSVKRLGVNLFY